MTTTVVSFINQKGGCGKSSSCFHLGGHFARNGSKVLLIDADPQGSLSQGFFGSAAIENLTSHQCLAAIFDDDAYADPESLIVETPFERLSIVRANASLSPHNVPQPERTGMKQFAMAGFLENISTFDLVLIDCPPNLYQCSWNALLASHYVVVPVPPEDFATQGLRTIHQAIEQARHLRPLLRLLGHLIIRADQRLLVHRSYEQQLRRLYGDTVFETVIPEAASFKVALACRQPVSIYSPNAKSSKRLGMLADEMLQRIARVEDKRRIA